MLCGRQGTARRVRWYGGRRLRETQGGGGMAHDAVRGQMAAPDLGRSRSTQHTTTIAAEAVTAARPAQRRRTNPSRPAAAGATAPASSSRQRAGCLEDVGAVFAI